MSLLRTLASRGAVAVLLLVLGASTTFAQDRGDLQQLFDQGMQAYRQGDYETAITKFREIVAQDPTQADAMQLLDASQDALLELMVAGGEFETFAKEVLRKAAAADREMRRDPEAAAEVAQGAFADSYAERNRAIFELATRFGPFGVPPLVEALGDPDHSRRLAAIYALSRMGSAVFVPVVAASHSEDENVRLGTLHVLNALGDPRADARVADMAANDPSAEVQALARKVLDDAHADPAVAHYEQGLAYFHHDPEYGSSPAENEGVLWTVEGRRLEWYEVPPAIVPLELAKHHLLRAMELGHPDAAPMVAQVYAAEVAILDGLAASGQDVAEQRSAQWLALLTLDHEAIAAGLEDAVRSGQPAVAEVLVRALDGPGGRDWPALELALTSEYPSLRVRAALALGHRGDFSAEVVSGLAEAVSLEAVRVVVIADPEVERAARLAQDLEEQGVVAVLAEDGGAGLTHLHLATHVDAVVVADPLPDMYAAAFVAAVRKDDRLAGVPVFVLGNEQTSVDDAEVVQSLDAATVVGAFPELDAERRGYETVAADAAETLLDAARRGSAGGAAAALAGAADRADAVAAPALRALGLAGDAAAADVLVGVVGDTGRSTTVRVAAADGAADLHARTGAGFDAQAFQAAMLEGDAALAEACARVLGVLGAGHLSAGVALQ